MHCSLRAAGPKVSAINLIQSAHDLHPIAMVLLQQLPSLSVTDYLYKHNLLSVCIFVTKATILHLVSGYQQQLVTATVANSNNCYSNSIKRLRSELL